MRRSEGDSIRKILFALTAIFLIAYAAYAAPAKPNSITFYQNASEHYANGAFSINWTGNLSNGNILNYSIYVHNASGFVMLLNNTSENGTLFSVVVNNGNYTFNISAVNETGESENATSTWIFVDLQNATIIHNSPANGLNTTNATANFSFNATDNTALNCSLYIDGILKNTNSSTANNTETILNSTLSEGRHLWNISCTDLANNTNTSTAYNIGIDLSAPSIILNSPANGEWNTNGKTNFTFKATDAVTAISNCSLWTNTTGTWAVNMTNDTIVNNTQTAFIFESNVLGNGTYLWNVECYDAVSNSSFALENYTFIIGNATDFTVTDIRLINSSNGNNPIPGSNLTINATIKNSGTLNSTSNMTVALFWEGSATPIGLQNISNETLTNGNSANITFNISGVNVTGYGSHTITVSADYGNLVNESNENNNDGTFILFTGLNTSANITTRAPKPGDNVSINITVKYQNGSAVTGLNQTNFTIYDIYTYDNGTNTSSRVANISYFNSSQNSSGIYSMNITTPAKDANNRAEYGNHFIRVSIKDNKSIEYYGEDNRTSNNYSMKAPNMAIKFYASSFDIDLINGDATRIISLQVKNTGTIDINNINITVYTNSSSLTLAYNSTHVRSIACNYSATLLAASNASYETVADCIIRYNSTTIGSYILTATAGGLDTDGATYNATAITQNVSVLNSSNTVDTASSSSSGSVAIIRYFTYTINITNYSKTVMIEQGASTNIIFAIKNLGNGTVYNLSVSLTNPDMASWGKWYNSTKVKMVVPKETVYVTTNISVPLNATVATYTITANASGSEANSFKLITFVLLVLPGNDTKKQIDISFDEILAQIKELNISISKLLENTNNINVTIASKKLAEVERLRLEAEQAILKGDYLTAYNNKKDIEALLPEIKQLISTETQIVEKKENQKRNMTLIAAFIISIAGLVYYMWLPEEGYTPGKGYFKKNQTPYLTRLKDGIHTTIHKSVRSPSDAVHEMINKDRQDIRYLKPKEQPYKYIRKDAKFSINKVYQNLINQFKEHGKAKGKPTYNFHKKQRWSDD
ncbi:MAG: CARDB domain-containing protein [Nanoarchaeota archaeon]|nr:hypothetical protein [Nanoarchaeota archaeon]MBU4300753.1 hypothetical protein [Nanoarchaeota archaeon]MBU4452379.1 hypothetical protein [Nanoarchaeota archaeon]MCG2723347.1 NEW3 domain-containing protein [archaeon]